MMDYTELRDRLAPLNTPQVRTELSKLTLNELYKASRDPALWAYAASITAEAASRYFRSTK